MNQAFLLVRTLETPLGARMLHPVKTYENESDAKMALERSKAAFEELIGGTIMVRTPEGPKAAMPVSNFLAELGVSGMGHNVLRLDIHGGLILAPVGAKIQ